MLKELYERYIKTPGKKVMSSLKSDEAEHSPLTDADGNVVSVLTENKYHLGLANLSETKWVFHPVEEPYRSIPKWVCLVRDDRVWKGPMKFCMSHRDITYLFVVGKPFRIVHYLVHNYAIGSHKNN